MLALQRGTLQIDTGLHRVQCLAQTLGGRLAPRSLDVVFPQPVHAPSLARTYTDTEFSNTVHTGVGFSHTTTR